MPEHPPVKLSASRRCVQAFLMLMERGLTEGSTVPRRLAVSSSLSASTGYRKIGALEEAGFLHRDTAATYMPGPNALRVGFSAWGFGEYCTALQPILHTVRQQTERTAIVGFIENEKMQIGLFSIGRGSGFWVPQPHAVYDLEAHGHSQDKPGEFTLRDSTAPASRDARVAMVVLSENLNIKMALGVVGLSTFQNSAHIMDSLRYAKEAIVSRTHRDE